MITYRSIFKQSLKIAFQHPSVWVFGFFAALLGVGSEMELLFGGYGFGVESIATALFQGFVQGGLLSAEAIRGFGVTFATNPVLLLATLAAFFVLLVVLVFAVWFVTVSQVALINESVAISRGRSFTWKENFQIGMQKFWPVLGVNIIIKLVIAVLLAVTGFIALINFPGFLFVYMAVFTVFLIAAIIASFLAKYAVLGIVLHDWTFADSFKKAFAVFKRNWLLSLELSALLFVIFFLANSFILYLLTLGYLNSLALFLEFSFGITVISWLVIIMLMIVSTLLSIFHWATWAVTFEILVSKKQALTSWLKRVFRYITQ